MAKSCEICTHPYKARIEAAMLDGMPDAHIASLFELPISQVRRHKHKCASYTMTTDEFDKAVLAELQRVNTPEAIEAIEHFKRPASIQDALSIREADLVAGAMKDYMVTVKQLGDRIQTIIGAMDTEEGMYQARGLLSKSICDLYVQAGAEVRQCAKTLSDMQKQKDTVSIEGAPIIQILPRTPNT